MRRNLAFILTLSAVCAAAPTVLTNAADASTAQGQYYCPPGAKFCPAPGADNSVALDTQFGVGATAGGTTAYGAPPSGEAVLYQTPAAPVQNKYVPYPGAPETNMTASTTAISRNASERAASLASANDLARVEPSRPAARSGGVEKESAVAGVKIPWWKGGMWRNDPEPVTTAYGALDSENMTNGDKVPWWKGGMWRNRKSDGSGGDRDSDSPSPATARKSGGSSSFSDGPGALRADDDMWGDDEDYSGYSAGNDYDYEMSGGFDSESFGNEVFAGGNNNNPYGAPQQQPYGAQNYGGQQPYAAANNPYAMPAQGYGGQPQYAAPPQQYAPQPYGQPQYAPQQPYGQPQYGQPQYAAPQPQYASQPQYGDPYGAQQQGYGNPQMYVAQPTYAGDPYAAQSPQYSTAPYPQSGGMVGDAYTLPNSPPPTSPYPDGYVYPGTNLSYESAYQGPQGGYAPDYGMTMPSSPVDSGSYYQESLSSPSEVPASPQFENAVALVKENRFGEAKGMLIAETSRNPSNAAAWRWLGDCHYNLLELDDAVSCYQRSLDQDPNDYYALRGQGFAYLHRGHEHWRRMQEEVASGQKEQAAGTFAQAHENYKKSLELLGLCLRRAPNDGEAIYGEAMAAEGASRKLYSNAISYLKLPDQRERAELFAENCLTVINKGIERSRERAKLNPGESGPRALLGGLYLRKAILYNQLGKTDLALVEIKNARDVQQSILDEIDKNNATAQKGVKECEAYWEAWGGNKS